MYSSVPGIKYAGEERRKSVLPLRRHSVAFQCSNKHAPPNSPVKRRKSIFEKITSVRKPVLGRITNEDTCFQIDKR